MIETYTIGLIIGVFVLGIGCGVCGAGIWFIRQMKW